MLSEKTTPTHRHHPPCLSANSSSLGVALPHPTEDAGGGVWLVVDSPLVVLAVSLHGV